MKIPPGFCSAEIGSSCYLNFYLQGKKKMINSFVSQTEDQYLYFSNVFVDSATFTQKANRHQTVVKVYLETLPHLCHFRKTPFI